MKGFLSLLLVVLIIVVSGCSLDEGTEKLFQQEHVLQVEIVLPTEMERYKSYEIQAFFTEKENEVPDIKEITFTIWKSGMQSKEKIVPQIAGNGMYTIHTTFEEEGIYFVKVEANTKDSKVMPTKQFTVGEVSAEDLNSLPQQGDKQNHEGHH